MRRETLKDAQFKKITYILCNLLNKILLMENTKVMHLTHMQV